MACLKLLFGVYTTYPSICHLLQILRTLYIIVVNETRSIIKVSKETDRAVNGDTSTTYHSNLQRLFRFLEYSNRGKSTTEYMLHYLPVQQLYMPGRRLNATRAAGAAASD